jgi:hypothetical protein
MPCGDVDQACGGGGFEVKAIGHLEQITGGHNDVFRRQALRVFAHDGKIARLVLHARHQFGAIRWQDTGVNRHSITLTELCDTFAKRINHTCAIAPNDMWEVKFQPFPAFTHE